MNAPEGECTCPSWLTSRMPADICDYCQDMMHWAHYTLYPEDDESLFPGKQDELDSLFDEEEIVL